MMRQGPAFILLAALAGCDHGPPAGAGEPTRTLAAAGAFEIDLPATPDAEHAGGRSTFTFEPEARSPRQLTVARRPRGTAASGYSRREFDGGSGGTEVELRISVRRCGHVVEVRCSAQGEPAPSMGWCERAVASLRCRQPLP